MESSPGSPLMNRGLSVVQAELDVEAQQHVDTNPDPLEEVDGTVSADKFVRTNTIAQVPGVSNKVKQSKWRREQEAYEINDGGHWGSLIYATFTWAFHFMNFVLRVLLLVEFYNKGWSGSALALLAIFAIESLFHIMFDWVNRGRCRYIIFDVLQLRMSVEYVGYLVQWCRHYRRPWAETSFRDTLAFESFLGSFPVLVVIMYLLVAVEGVDGDATVLMVLTFISGCGVGLFHLMSLYNFLDVSNTVYACMIAKGFLNSGIRILLAAYLFDILGLLAVGVVAGIFIIGVILYYVLKRGYFKRGHDDPLVYWQCHVVFSFLCAATSTFVSFPFAPTHFVTDWWNGYNWSELKLNIENLAAAALVILQVKSDFDDDVLFFSVVGFAALCAVANLAMLCYLNKQVDRELKRRRVLSTVLIVRLFAFSCEHLEAKIRGGPATDTDATTGDSKALNYRDSRFVRSDAEWNQLQNKHRTIPTGLLSADAKLTLADETGDGRVDPNRDPLAIGDDMESSRSESGYKHRNQFATPDELQPPAYDTGDYEDGDTEAQTHDVDAIDEASVHSEEHVIEYPTKPAKVVELTTTAAHDPNTIHDPNAIRDPNATVDGNTVMEGKEGGGDSTTNPPVSRPPLIGSVNDSLELHEPIDTSEQPAATPTNADSSFLPPISSSDQRQMRVTFVDSDEEVLSDVEATPESPAATPSQPDNTPSLPPLFSPNAKKRIVRLV